MKKLWLTVFLLFGAESLRGADAPCPKVDPAKIDQDGIPFCPDLVKQTSMFAIYRCATAQATSWHPPTKAEIAAGRSLIGAFKARNYKAMMARANDMRAQICRVVDGDDKYLAVFAKYGVTDYNGPNMMLRDAAKVSKVWILAPHTDSDGYAKSHSVGFQKTHALADFSNGYPRRGRESDFSHSKTTLGWYMVKEFGELFPKSVVWHMHGMKTPDKVLYRPLKGPLAKPYENAIRQLTGIKDFQGFNAYYEVDPPTVNTGWYVKSEVPARIWVSRERFAAELIKIWEKEDWAWTDKPEPSPEPEPTFSPEPDDGDEEVEIPDDGEEDTTVVDDEDVSPEPSPSPIPVPWKPAQKPKLGGQELICVAVQYSSGPSASVDKCKDVANSVASFYKRQSVGKWVMTPKAVSFAFAGPANRNSHDKAADQLRAKYPKALLIMPMLFWDGPSNAGQRVANLNHYGSGSHEVGHLLGLGHCGAYRPDGFDPYGGGGCIMSKYFSNAYLAPSQYVYLSWYTKDQYAIQDVPTPKQYSLRAISALQQAGLGTVAIPPALLGGGRPGFIAWPPNCQNDPCLAFYYATGGGSQRVKIFGKEFKDEKTGLTIKNLGLTPDHKVKVEVSVAKPVQ